jgi:hypothetical protein
MASTRTRRHRRDDEIGEDSVAASTANTTAHHHAATTTITQKQPGGPDVDARPAWMRHLPHPLDREVHQTTLDPWSEDSCRDYVINVALMRVNQLPTDTVNALYHETFSGVSPGSARALPMGPSPPHDGVPSLEAQHSAGLTPARDLMPESSEAGSSAQHADMGSKAAHAESVDAARKMLQDLKNVVLDRFSVRQMQFVRLLVLCPPPSAATASSGDDAAAARTPLRPGIDDATPAKQVIAAASSQDEFIRSIPVVSMRKEPLLIALRNLYFDLMRMPLPAAKRKEVATTLPATAAAGAATTTEQPVVRTRPRRVLDDKAKEEATEKAIKEAVAAPSTRDDSAQAARRPRKVHRTEVAEGVQESAPTKATLRATPPPPTIGAALQPWLLRRISATTPLGLRMLCTVGGAPVEAALYELHCRLAYNAAAEAWRSTFAESQDARR